MDKFMLVPKMGMLRYDKIFFETYYPILFTCMDNKNNLFLCVCCQCNKDGKKWLLSKTTPNVLINLLKNKITIRDAFLKFKDVRLSICWNNEEPFFVENDESDWDFENSKSLPDAGEFIDAEVDEFAEEIKYYQEITDDLYASIEIEKTIRAKIKSNEKVVIQYCIEISGLNLNGIGLKSEVLKQTFCNSSGWFKEKTQIDLDISYNAPAFKGISHSTKKINSLGSIDEYTIFNKDSIYLPWAS